MKKKKYLCTTNNVLKSFLKYESYRKEIWQSQKTEFAWLLKKIRIRKYCKVPNSRMFCLVAPPRIYRLFTKGKFNAYLLFRAVVPGCAGCATAHPDFGRPVNPISTRGDRLCPPNYFWPTRIFRPSDGPESLVPQIKLQSNSCQYPLIDYLGVNAP